MNLTIFAKKCTTEAGKKFDRFLTRLPLKSGETLSCAVKFTEEAGVPKASECPMNIIVDKADANRTEREYTREDTGERVKAYTLWISKWKKGAPYVDHSLDDVED